MTACVQCQSKVVPSHSFAVINFTFLVSFSFLMISSPLVACEFLFLGGNLGMMDTFG